MNPQNPEPKIRCEVCKGRGTIEALTDFQPFGKPKRTPCATCLGDGFLPRHRQQWLAQGRLHRSQRMRSGENIVHAARRLGLSVDQVLDMESGRKANQRLRASETAA